jgi:hypothetical protein
LRLRPTRAAEQALAQVAMGKGRRPYLLQCTADGRQKAEMTLWPRPADDSDSNREVRPGCVLAALAPLSSVRFSRRSRKGQQKVWLARSGLLEVDDWPTRWLPGPRAREAKNVVPDLRIELRAEDGFFL